MRLMISIQCKGTFCQSFQFVSLEDNTTGPCKYTPHRKTLTDRFCLCLHFKMKIMYRANPAQYYWYELMELE